MLLGAVVDRVEHRNVVGAPFGRAVDRAVGIDRRIAPVGGNFIVQVHLGSAPVPDARRRRCARRPAAVRASTSAVRRRRCGRSNPRKSSARAACRAGRRWRAIAVPACPDWMRRIQPAYESRLLEFRLNRARRLVAELVAADAAVGLDGGEPHGLALDGSWDSIAI